MERKEANPVTTQRCYAFAGLAIALLLAAGCNSQTSGNGGSTGSDGGSTTTSVAAADASDGGGASNGGTTDAGKTTAGASGGDADGGDPTNGAVEVKPPPKFPEIKLSEQHEQTLVLKQGDTMPDFELPGLDGQPQKLSAHLGERFTVVFFWPGEGRIALREAPQQLADLQIDIAEAFADRGVKVVGISYKQTAEDTKGIVDKAEISFPILLDESGDAFAQVATEILPRTYLLDNERRILWFDLLYSFDTMRNLKQALAFVLADDGDNADGDNSDGGDAANAAGAADDAAEVPTP